MSTTAPHIDALLRDLKAALADLYGERLHRVVLYGSHARGEATEASDIDVMVVLTLGSTLVDLWEELSRMAEVALQQELKYEEMITLLPVSRSHYEAADTPLLASVHREGRRL